LKLPGYQQNPARFLRCSWSRPKTEWVDPLKDAKAAKEEIAMGVNTLTEFCETAGRDIEEVVATRKYEKKLFEAAGVASDLAGVPATPAPVTGENNDAK
jgi:capsid protein